MNQELLMSPNRLVTFLQKPAAEFTKADIINYIQQNEIRMVNFMYPAADGRLKTLNFVINNASYLDAILTCGERVDGSSLFPFIEAGSSDLYVIPRFRTAFVDPFAEIPTLVMLCSFFNKDGEPLESSPEYTLHKACKAFTDVTGMEFQAMGELEYYVISEDDGLFPATDQRGYHESGPYVKFNDFRTQCMSYIAQTGGQIKYGHSEVGNFMLDGKVYEQNEIEFLPVNAENAADQLMIAKWVIRNLAYQYGYDITFAPKITVGKAGSGLHIHMRMMKDGQNQMLKDGVLSDTARKAIAGMMQLAPSITAFGNTNPTSYFRLVPHQEAPTNVCWGDRNRSVLVRVPLGWSAQTDMCALANPLESDSNYDTTQKQTVEMRSPDGSADLYQLLAGLAVACRHGFEIENALAIAEQTYVNVNIHQKENADKLKALAQLPDSCAASADCLQKQRTVFEQYNVFSPAMIDGIISRLRSYNDATLRKDIQDKPEEMLALVSKFFHCG
ncbi:glutamine synthetase, catalytic domain protein [Bacteroides fragilis str. S6L8]|uniref:Glutamine synthetase, catalytic domain protein n=1 Tax=Bacteroides fragilis str. S36L11 TaxID=1339327 RepID=A0A015Y954_BACFG|nr:glutamine synthetase family protein [Bacteroides fragilis]EYE49896.1 glutamine synthetase, catalytic domain protein [Bacteroides fragilis str. S6L5]EXZ28507.1 glutamine synthetase, catalytic domain protein [Bacteroides fragilis str. S36L11]EYA04567.1 glutamine synthetase, catalytic domain protein [Bacteroides fragilis str. S6L3]EYA85465.1 glutamine synthetase, catalytic domain protein [Bacteroides fragilis str. S36L12]EYA90797.1 glutamine synthetase, catalytic domain protein [Bacteroides fr